MMAKYLVDGPGGIKWSIWDHGDEMCVNRGPDITSDVVATVPQPIARKMDAAHRWQHVVSAASSIRVSALLDGDSPNFHLLWR